MKRIELTILVFILVLLSSCYKELDLEKHRPAPKMVLNCALSADSLIEASVSRTWFYTEDHPNVVLKDVDVDIYVNDEFRERMYWQEDHSLNQYNALGKYVSTVIPKVGDRIRIIATGPLGTAWAESYIPEKVPITNVEISRQGGKYASSGIIYKVTFRDPPETEDYYMINVRDSASSIYISFEEEPLVLPGQSTVDKIFSDNWINGMGGAVFSDELINGKEYTLQVREHTGVLVNWSGEDHPWNEGYSVRYIELYKISADYYKYLKILQHMGNYFLDDLADIGMAEPVRMHTNVEGGTGMVGGYNKYVVTKDIEELLYSSN